jgi:hypothetical protein
MDPAEIRFIRKAFIKRKARKFLEKKSAHPPLCESPLKIMRHLVQLLEKIAKAGMKFISP